MAPGPLPPDQRTELERDFDTAELTELALGVGLFHGFSKVLIGLGQEPESMETMLYPTPDFETPTPDIDLDDPHVQVLAACPDLAARWALTYRALWETGAVDAGVLDAVRARVARLLAVDWAPAAEPNADPALTPALCVAELFVMDVRAIAPEQVSDLRVLVGEPGLIQLFVGLALWDGIYRIDRTLGA